MTSLHCVTATPPSCSGFQAGGGAKVSSKSLTHFETLFSLLSTYIQFVKGQFTFCKQTNKLILNQNLLLKFKNSMKTHFEIEGY